MTDNCPLCGFEFEGNRWLARHIRTGCPAREAYARVSDKDLRRRRKEVSLSG